MNPASSSSPSSSSAAMNNELEHASCCVCLNAYNRTNRAPVSILCGHTFCHSCACRLTTKKLFCCAVCRTVTPLGWSAPQKNLAVIEALEKLNLLASDDTHEKLDSSPKGDNDIFQIVENINPKDMLPHGIFCMEMFSCYLDTQKTIKAAETSEEIRNAIQSVEALMNGDNRHVPVYSSDSGSDTDLEVEMAEFNSDRNNNRSTQNGGSNIEDPIYLSSDEDDLPNPSGVTRPSSDGANPSRAGPVLRPRRRVVDYGGPTRRTRRSAVRRRLPVISFEARREEAVRRIVESMRTSTPEPIPERRSPVRTYRRIRNGPRMTTG